MRMSKNQLKRKKALRWFLTPFKNFNEWLFEHKDSEVLVKCELFLLAGILIYFFHMPLIKLIKTSLILTFGLALVLLFVGIVAYVALDFLNTVVITCIGTLTEPFCFKYYEVNEDIEEYYHRTIRTYIKDERSVIPVQISYYDND